MADAELVERIVASTDLSPAEADRVVEDVLAWYSEPVVDYLRRRHAELRLRGVRNEQIYRTLVAEAGRRPFAAPALSERQVRRHIYG
ncbi:MAG TPA: hypothetical protein VMB79_09595 [Jatrophihabitans sp.]|nr:hypothetical protein [Jatrophihabitans sp.]